MTPGTQRYHSGQCLVQMVPQVHIQNTRYLNEERKEVALSVLPMSYILQLRKETSYDEFPL